MNDVLTKPKVFPIKLCANDTHRLFSRKRPHVEKLFEYRDENSHHYTSSEHYEHTTQIRQTQCFRVVRFYFLQRILCLQSKKVQQIILAKLRAMK